MRTWALTKRQGTHAHHRLEYARAIAPDGARMGGKRTPQTFTRHPYIARTQTIPIGPYDPYTPRTRAQVRPRCTQRLLAAGGCSRRKPEWLLRQLS